MDTIGKHNLILKMPFFTGPLLDLLTELNGEF
jgi:hypothetical protein